MSDGGQKKKRMKSVTVNQHVQLQSLKCSSMCRYLSKPALKQIRNMMVFEMGSLNGTVWHGFRPGEHFMKLFVGNFHRQMLKATEMLASD